MKFLSYILFWNISSMSTACILIHITTRLYYVEWNSQWLCIVNVILCPNKKGNPFSNWIFLRSYWRLMFSVMFDFRTFMVWVWWRYTQRGNFGSQSKNGSVKVLARGVQVWTIFFFFISTILAKNLVSSHDECPRYFPEILLQPLLVNEVPYWDSKCS